MDKIIFSMTAYQSGFGSDRFKSVCGLTPGERQAAREGSGIVVFNCGRPSGGGNGTGTVWRYVQFDRGYYNPRVPDDRTLAIIEAIIQKQED